MSLKIATNEEEKNKIKFQKSYENGFRTGTRPHIAQTYTYLIIKSPGKVGERQIEICINDSSISF